MLGSYQVESYRVLQSTHRVTLLLNLPVYLWTPPRNYIVFKSHRHTSSYVDTVRKCKGGIFCGSYLAIMYGGELMYLLIFWWLRPPSKLLYPRGLKSCTHTGYCVVNHAVMKCEQIAPNKRELLFPCGLKLCTHIGYRGNDNVPRSCQ